MHRIVQTLFWFHPLVWWLGARLIHERERACDEDVLQQGFEPQIYARAMLKVCEFCLSAPSGCVAGVTGSDLKKRIEAVMVNRTALHLSYAKKGLLAAVGMSSVLSVVVLGSMRQSRPPKPLTFEEASIRPANPGRELTFGSCHGTDSSPYVSGPRLPGSEAPARPGLGRCVLTGVTLKRIAFLAYALPPNIEMTGGPGWSDSDRFDIDAKAEDPSTATASSLQQMLQQLLADRFKLKVHRDIKEVSGFHLVVAKNGAKLKEGTDDGKNPPIGGNPADGEMFFRASTLQPLAEVLSQLLGRAVQDKTGLTGRYTFDLKWTPTEVDVTAKFSPEATKDLQPGPALVTALQDQLGLRLQSGKVPVPLFVIDSAEKPAPN